MFLPEEQQIEICLLKSDLEEIENDLVVQISSLPALDAENEQKYRQTMSALRLARSLNEHIERLKLENVKKTAKRLQLKKQCEDLSRDLDNARQNRNELSNALKQEENEMEINIRKYEDMMQEKADRFRKTRNYYNEGDMNANIAEVIKSITELEHAREMQQSIVDDLKQQLEELRPEVQDDLLSVFGKPQLDKKINELTRKVEAMMKERKSLIGE